MWTMPFKSMSAENKEREYGDLYEKAKTQILSNLPHMEAYQGEPVFQSMIKTEMIGELNKQQRGKK